ncbi:MAG: cellulose binding domain-containing protein, partial [Oscillospiraceae bacterium]|nr:cellulose binding domain-containing protein [Oscillospiraceae bacterium]
MLNIKKIFSTFIGAAMTANALITMPFSAFADEETECTYTYDGYEVSYDVTNSWGNTEVVSVTLYNTGDSTIENWMLYFEPNGQVHNTVNVQEAQTSTGITYFRNSGYNANINPDSSVSFSYMIDDCEAAPDNFTLCQKREEKEFGYEVSLKVNQTWGDAFNGEIIIQNNTDKAIESWELTVDTNFTITEITNSWAATVTELEPYSYMLKGTYTGTVYPNSSVSLGFNGVKSGEPTITDYSLTEVVVDEEIIKSSELNNITEYDNYISNKIYSEALYDPKNEKIDISWTAEAIGSYFEVYISDDNKDYELYETVDGNTFNSVYHIKDDFIVKYIKIKQTLDDGNIIYSNICYAVYAPIGVEWTEYLRDWKIPADDEIMSKINAEDAPYKLSLEVNAAGVPDIHLN